MTRRAAGRTRSVIARALPDGCQPVPRAGATESENRTIAARLFDCREREDAVVNRLREESHAVAVARSSELAHAQSLDQLLLITAELDKTRSAEAAEARRGNEHGDALQRQTLALDDAVAEVRARDMALQEVRSKGQDSDGLVAEMVKLRRSSSAKLWRVWLRRNKLLASA